MGIRQRRISWGALTLREATVREVPRVSGSVHPPPGGSVAGQTAPGGSLHIAGVSDQFARDSIAASGAIPAAGR